MDNSARSETDQQYQHVRVSVVIPALNEAENLPHVLPKIPSWVHEVVLVDGHSVDGTADVARGLIPTIRVVNQSGKGKGDALRCGFEHATGDIVVMLDADGSTDPGEIPAFIEPLLAGAHFVKGSRFMRGGGTSDMSWYRMLGNWGFVLMVRTLYGGRYSDLCYGYNAFWRWVVPILRLDVDGFEIETVMNVRALQAGLTVKEVPSFEALRISGVSRLRTIPDGWRVLKAIVREGFQPKVRRTAGFERTGSGMLAGELALASSAAGSNTAIGTVLERQDVAQALLSIEVEAAANALNARPVMPSRQRGARWRRDKGPTPNRAGGNTGNPHRLSGAQGWREVAPAEVNVAVGADVWSVMAETSGTTEPNSHSI
jgi:hypothetical protein